MSFLRLLVGFAALLTLSCAEQVHCDELVGLACDKVENRRDGVEQCALLRKQSEAVDDEQCKDILRNLTERTRAR